VVRVRVTLPGGVGACARWGLGGGLGMRDALNGKPDPTLELYGLAGGEGRLGDDMERVEVPSGGHVGPSTELESEEGWA
jgi:hypothetical protein